MRVTVSKTNLAASLALSLVLTGAPHAVSAQMAFTRTALPSDSSNIRRVKSDSTIKADTTRKNKSTFSAKQQANNRVLAARLEKRFELKKLFRERGLTYPAAETFLRIFKRERLLEVWVRSAEQGQFTLLKSYPICAMAGALGPKRSQGDGQTPEGFYYIDGFNPASDFHLSLRIDYPNRSDRLLNKGHDLGGDIYIHGGCKTEGCLAVNDDAIKELYWLAVEARDVGQQRIPVHIFPARLTDGELYRLTSTFDEKSDLKRFWANLKSGFDYFEAQHRLPVISVDKRGRYHMQPPPSPIAAPPAPTVDTAAVSLH